MKFKCGKTQAEKDAKFQWHQWFAWKPVSVGEGDCRWLEVVERKYFAHTGFEYDGGGYCYTYLTKKYRALTKPE